MKKLSLIIGMCFLAINIYAAIETKTFDAVKIKSLNIKNQSGNINIVATKSNKATVEIKKNKFDKDCRLNISLSSSTLNVHIDGESWFDAQAINKGLALGGWICYKKSEARKESVSKKTLDFIAMSNFYRIIEDA